MPEPARPNGDDPARREEPPDLDSPSTWIGEVVRMVRYIVDNNGRTIRMCILITAATVAWAVFR
ncbi:hypothetical protein AB0J28_04580 [Streptosporangium canum]|uniref:hypothetical protein n=1 Tax=Streptosporangium canum TaxID=324952 RepID=UPI003428B5AE